jgi:hypothetical protein
MYRFGRSEALDFPDLDLQPKNPAVAERWTRQHVLQNTKLPIFSAPLINPPKIAPRQSFLHLVS